MDDLKHNPNSHLTAKERDRISFPARLLHQNGLIVGKTLDFGCGFGKDVEVLRQQGHDITGYDKHYFPAYPQETYDTILCLYVLNVLMPEEQTRVLMEVAHLLKPGGKAYFAVRRDITRPGFRKHKIHEKDTYQTNVVLPLPSFFENENCQIYVYQHFNQLPAAKSSACPFCQPPADQLILTESLNAYAIYDKFPVNPGHVLIIPKQHVASYFDLSFRKQSSCWFMLNYVQELVQQQFHPNGFNVGINIHDAAGQTIPHVHIHLIPRYAGDLENPAGGVRGVIPERRGY